MFSSPNKLRCPRECEVSNWDDITTVPDDTGLLTVKCWKKIVEDQTTKSANKKSTWLRSKYSEIDCALVSVLIVVYCVMKSPHFVLDDYLYTSCILI